MLHSEILKAIAKMNRQNDFTGDMPHDLKLLKNAISEQLKSDHRTNEIEAIVNEIDSKALEVMNHIRYALHEGKEEVDRQFR